VRLRNVDQITCKQVTVTPLSQALPNLGHIFGNEGGLANLTGCDVPPATM